MIREAIELLFLFAFFFTIFLLNFWLLTIFDYKYYADRQFFFFNYDCSTAFFFSSLASTFSPVLGTTFSPVLGTTFLTIFLTIFFTTGLVTTFGSTGITKFGFQENSIAIPQMKITLIFWSTSCLNASVLRFTCFNNLLR